MFKPVLAGYTDLDDNYDNNDSSGGSGVDDDDNAES
jgi:hypothetical protein